MEWRELAATKNKAEVLQFLQQSGWDVKRQRFYNHCSQGKLLLNRDGYYTWRAVKKYAETNLVRSDTGESAEQAETRLAETKLQKEIERLEIRNRRESFQEQVELGLYLLRENVEMELCARAVILDGGLEHMIRSKTAEIVALCNGEQRLVSDCIEFWLERKDELMNNFARMDGFDVEISPEHELPLLSNNNDEGEL